MHPTDPIVLAIVSVLHGLVAASAWYISRPARAPYYKPVAYLFIGSLVTELVRWVNRECILKPLPRPLTGWHRVPGHLEQALALAWPAAVVAVVAWVLFAGTARRMIVGLAVAAYLILLGYLITHYPEIRGDRLGGVYRAASIVEVGTCLILCLVSYLGAPRWPLLTERVALLVIGAETARFAGAIGWGRSPMSDADLDAITYGALYMVVLIVQGLWACRARTTGRETE